jgi:iron complex outermembrane recepter protein
MKNIINKTFFIALVLTASNSFAQTPETKNEDLFDMDLNELMDIQIVSASKKTENLFEAPFSSSVITKDEIKKAGCTSIMEAFRLMPGLIVREQTNGNFDVHIRGLDNVPSHGVSVNSANTTTLVMIDNRPVYNYLQGGTFWESLPIDINDVDRIEIVRGPSSAMYGPNSVSGVINIISRKPEKDGIYALANAQYGGNKTAVTNATVGFQPNSKFNFLVSGNYQSRDRNKAEYYETKSNSFVALPVSTPSFNTVAGYPDRMQAMDKYGANAFVNYQPYEKVNFNLSTGIQNSEVQKAYGENLVTPISTAVSNSSYADLKVGLYDFSAQLSANMGSQDPSVGFVGSKYDFETLDGFFEYAIKIKSITLKPGYNYRKAVYDDSKYWDGATKEGIISGQKNIETHAFSLRSEYKMFKDKLRLFGGGRLDKFNNPGKAYISYQLSTNYNINKENLVRFVISKANRSPFIYDTYIDLAQSSDPINMGAFQIPVVVNVTGNKDIKLVTSNMIELGYRSKLAKNLQLDIDLFKTTTTNYTELILGETDMSNMPSNLNINVSVKNLPLEIHQWGSTFSVNYVLNKIQFKPFATVQYTEAKNFSSYFNTSVASPSSSNMSPQTNNYLTTTDVKHKGTPGIYGGAYINYQVSDKFNINLNPYFYSSQTFYNRSYNSFNDGMRGVDNIRGKVLINARVSYKPVKILDVFVSAKNLLGDTSREYYKSDRIGTNVLAGVNFEF